MGDLEASDLVVTMLALVEVVFLEVASLEALMLVMAEAMQPLQQEHLARLSLVHCRLRKSSRIVQCLSHSTGLSPCQHLSQIRCQCLSPSPHLSSGPWKKW